MSSDELHGVQILFEIADELLQERIIPLECFAADEIPNDVVRGRGQVQVDVVRFCAMLLPLPSKNKAHTKNAINI